MRRVLDCPQLQVLKKIDRVDCCVALMDGDCGRVHRILYERQRKSCHVCDERHELGDCPWLQGMPDEMKDALRSCYRTLRMRDKDKILRDWVEMRRYMGLPIRDEFMVT